jgi:autotransporter family porin
MKRARVAAVHGGWVTVVACLAVAVAGCGTAAPAGHRAAPHQAAQQRNLAAQAATPGGVTAGGANLGTGSAPAKAAPKSRAAAQAAAAPAYFHTLPPGAKLPSGAQCAKWVRVRPYAENKGVNRHFNHTTGHHVSRSFLSGDKPQADKVLVPRIDGNFTGTTGQVLRWAACKWGIAQNVVFAQAAVESWWRQTTKGDWESNGCPPGHGPGVDGRKGLCPQSWGILQNRYPFEKSSWPGIAKSTAMNADTAYAIWRSCFDGYETWLNTVEHVGKYHAGDLWGCVGRWFAGRWHTAPAQQYTAKVKQYMRERIWKTKNFQQP